MKPLHCVFCKVRKKGGYFVSPSNTRRAITVCIECSTTHEYLIPLDREGYPVARAKAEIVRTVNKPKDNVAQKILSKRYEKLPSFQSNLVTMEDLERQWAEICEAENFVQSRC